MLIMEVHLPGGLPDNGRIERRVRFQPMTGRIEQALIESAHNPDRPAYVTDVLSHALKSIGDLPIDRDTVARLTVADRQYLMLRLAAMLNGEQLWLNVQCSHCQSLFDVEVKRSELPVKPAGHGFPHVMIAINDWQIDAGVPTGKDQEGIRGLEEQQAVHWLLRQCVYSVNGQAPTDAFFAQLTEADIAAIDEALDDVSPAVCDRLLVTCPECSCEQCTRLDHYAQLGLDEHFFYDEIHTLASHYHWSEADILDLPQHKRRRYLDLINRSAAGYGRG
ncbi:hypothetical protein FCL47_12285 [Desulfopila sp. IMCC35006]|uniref:T4 family baseplate hub assembly chaperone n=1 Tax=Desulfopila sp. IMCC35006 TaxID=2569542 RepID=UPI0010AC10CD|nr:hypothetical protein [Desulfopila sp. IMCC35006]TKB25868.1 hypothetical protein FCL47_12285 [Desulfopila sp. IMCC35006]